MVASASSEYTRISAKGFMCFTLLVSYSNHVHAVDGLHYKLRLIVSYHWHLPLNTTYWQHTEPT